MFLPRHLVLALAAATVSACASAPLPAPKPVAIDSAGIAVRVRTRAPVSFGMSKQADQVVFLRLDEGDSSSSYMAGQVCPSNYTKDGYAYLLNAAPGRYVAVASFESISAPPQGPAPGGGGGFSVSVNVGQGQTHYSTYFSKDLVRKTETDVRPGAITFMGEYVVDQSSGMDGADDVQIHHYRLLAPGHEEKSGFTKLFSGDYHYRGREHESKQDDTSRQAFLKSARVKLVEAGWSKMIE